MPIPKTSSIYPSWQQFLADRGLSLSTPGPDWMDYRRGERADYGEQDQADAQAPEPVATPSSPYAGILPWRQPTVDANGEMTGTTEVPIPIQQVGTRRRVDTPDGSAEWTPGTTPEQLAEAQERSYSAWTEPITRLNELRAGEDEQRRVALENLAANIQSTGGSYWGRTGEPARLARVKELEGTLQSLGGSEALRKALYSERM